MIWKQEFRKLICHPMLWSMLCVFLVFNGFLLWVNIGDYVSEMQMVHNEILDNGINPEYYEGSLSRYDTLDMEDVKEMKQEMYRYYPTGSFKEFIDTRYEKLNERVEEIVASSEHEGSVYPGEVYRLHKKLYVNVLRWVFLEMGLLVVFTVLFIMDYERIQGTVAITYASNVGRKVQCIKWCVGILTGIAVGGILLALTLGAWFLLIPYEGFWDISMSAALLTEPRGILVYPFITFHKMTIVQYLVATILVGVLLVVILGLIVGIMQLCINNSYLSFVGIALMLLCGLYIWGFSTATWFDIVLSWNPTVLWYTMGNYFMEGNLASNFNGAEIISLSVQGVSCFVMGRFAYNKFLKRDC